MQKNKPSPEGIVFYKSHILINKEPLSLSHTLFLQLVAQTLKRLEHFVFQQLPAHCLTLLATPAT